MRPAYGTPISAPSASLLRFLRSQSQEICFFTPSAKSNSSPNSLQPGQKSFRKKGNDFIRPSSKNFATSSRRQATCEASVFNLHFPRYGPARHARTASELGVGSRQSILKRSARPEIANKSRQASELFRPLLQRLWGSRKRNGAEALKPNDLPGLPSFLDDANGQVLGRSKLGKASNEMKLRCTELDENGTVTVVNGEFKKSELIAKVGVGLQLGLRLKAYDDFSTASSLEILGRSIPPPFHIS
jgi:magnesium transporter